MRRKYREAIRDALSQAMANDDRVLVLGQDVGVPEGLFRLTEGLIGEFGPERVIDTPISESGMAGAAVGLALLGMRPVVEVAFADHLAVCFDAIINQMAKIPQLWPTQVREMPIVIRSLTGAGIGGGPQHSQSLESLFAHIPGLEVALPSTTHDAHWMLRQAIESPRPVVFLEHKALLRVRGEVGDSSDVPFGRARIVRPGDDITLVSYSATMRIVEEAAKAMASDGVGAEVIDLRSVVPLDMDTVLSSVAKTRSILVVHEAHSFGGVGAEICAQISEQGALDGVVVGRLTPPRVAVPVDKNLEERYRLAASDVKRAAGELIDRQIRVAQSKNGFS